jgi:hypothetical protein
MEVRYRNKLDDEDYAILLGVVLNFLLLSEVQRKAVKSGHVHWIWDMFAKQEERIINATAADKKLLSGSAGSWVWILSDIAALPEFASHQSEWVQNVVSDVIVHHDQHSLSPHILSAACQIVANLLWPTANLDSTIRRVYMDRLRTPVLELLCRVHDPDLLHSASGLLLYLLRPSEQMKEATALSSEGETALERLCRHSNPQIQKDGMKLLQFLGLGKRTVQDRYSQLANDVVSNAVDRARSVAQQDA